MSRVFVIAEAGVNHNGSLERALHLVRAAAQAGADAVKFQTFSAKSLVSKNAPKAEYQKETTGSQESQLEMIQKLELSPADHHQLMALCQELGILFMSAAFDLQSIQLLSSLGLHLFKIPSGEITNLPYLEAIGALSKEIILSTGMCNLEEISQALEALEKAGTHRNQITLLHCNTQYPTPMEDVNLRAMQTMAYEFQLPVGYSDHTLGIEVPLAAVALGAVVIEKHFTLDKSLPGPDHRASLEPDELAAMVAGIRNLEKALGSPIKQVSPSEEKNRSIARKSIVAALPIQAGEVFTPRNLTTKRPGDGLSPMLWHQVLGQRAIRDFAPDEPICLEEP